MARNAWGNEIDCMIGATSNEGIVMGFELNLAKKYDGVEILQDAKYFTPFLETGLNLNDPKAIEFGQRIKQIYYGQLKPSKTNVEGFYYFMGDYWFWHGIYRAVLSRVALKSNGRTFLYRYDVDTGLNFTKILSKNTEVNGTEHGGDICHLFKGSVQSPPAIDSIEFKNVLKTVAIFSNFLIHGTPDCEELGGVKWNAIEYSDGPLKCLNIGTNECTFVELPELPRLNVFSSVLIDAGIALY